MRIKPLLAVLPALIFLTTEQAVATYDCASDAMVVFDGSASMSEIGWDASVEPRIGEAREAMRTALPDISRTRRLGLLIYGPGRNDACSNIELRFGPIANAAPRMIAALDALSPAGLTPLTESVRRAAQVLRYQTKPAVVVLVTDGNETCGGTPCQTGAALEAAGHDLTVHVVGFKAEVEFFSWDNPEQQSADGGATVARCLADQTGGVFVPTETVGELVDALYRTLGCSVVGAAPPDANRHRKSPS